MPTRIRLSRAKGWRKPEGAVVVSRPTLWRNPFVVGRDGTRAQVVYRYAALMAGYIVARADPDPDEQRMLYEHVHGNLDRIRGRDLCCWCALDGPCHAEVLLALANRPAGEPLDLERFWAEPARTELMIHIRDMDRMAQQAAAGELR
ncbi:hypothetical protein DDZ14_08335 [Maritimibacter sp. 55A14]|uniref:DUF4326 domain-containing protein n=1 Tax=Maritimibacter sp. 55A14 TaxID=2174844 RepID=UPI000D61F562|nr:DUF4326 domain-containing protein [Maritimibacter sp. 55A14]PWE32744.1 hypothetical protein DDZ14_08335 [Maritimibacter sp. 55A14]